jgi:hypothetical protein
LHPDGRSLIAGLLDDTSVLLDATTGQEQSCLSQGGTRPGDCFHPMLPWVVLGQWAKELKAFRAEAEEALRAP